MMKIPQLPSSGTLKIHDTPQLRNSHPKQLDFPKSRKSFMAIPTCQTTVTSTSLDGGGPNLVLQCLTDAVMADRLKQKKVNSFQCFLGGVDVRDTWTGR